MYNTKKRARLNEEGVWVMPTVPAGITKPVAYTPRFNRSGIATVSSNLKRDNRKVIPKVKGIPSALKKAIKALAEQEMEIKVNQYNQNISARGTIATADVLNIMPTISVGNNQASRIGNRVRIKRLIVDLVISPANGLTTPTVCRILIFRWKGGGDAAFTASDAATFYDNNGSSTAGTGAVSDQVLQMNNDVFETLYDRVTPAMAWPTNNTTQGIQMEYKQYKYSIDVPAARGLLTFDDGATGGDKSIYMVVQGVNTNGTTTNAAGTAVANVFQNITAYYTDA